MRVHSSAVALVASLSLTAVPRTSGFVPSSRAVVASRAAADRRDRPPRPGDGVDVLLPATSEATSPSDAPVEKRRRRRKKLGLITFDLDDTLYPIAPVLDEANRAFSSAMSNFGYVGIEPGDIVETGKGIRAAVSEEGGEGGSSEPGSDPLRPTTVNHREIRMAAIRKEMEGFILRTKLRQTAEDWATEVESLTSPVRKSAEKWARTTVHSSVVQAVYNAWEMERHHAAERHLFPDAISTIKRIREEHPDVVVGAVTDGSANPMLMVFSLMPLFDFSVSWEDDLDDGDGVMSSDGRFRELSSVDESDGLGWIYRLAVEKGREMSGLAGEIRKNGNGNGGGGEEDQDDDDDAEWCWVHVGDDLAYDVGGSATTGAKTVLADLAPEYGQTARLRAEGRRPRWATETEEQLASHKEMSVVAESKVDARVSHLGQLPEVIDELLKGEHEEDEEEDEDGSE